MSVKRNLVVYKTGIASAMLALLGAVTFAQEANEAPDNSSEQVEDLPALAPAREEIEEIIVTAPKPGARRRFDPVYIDPMKERLLKDLDEMQRIDEESAWRESGVDNTSSRIKWGYDPRDEYRIRSEMDVMNSPSDTTRPATVFSVEF
jgi:hypothetical protein